MSFKCPVTFCKRTFSQRSAYRQHVQLCLKKTQESNSGSNSNSENNVDEVIIWFLYSQIKQFTNF